MLRPFAGVLRAPQATRRFFSDRPAAVQELLSEYKGHTFSHVYDIPVRWIDMDAMGHVNNAEYFTYAESARCDFFDQVGLDLSARPEGPILAHTSCAYKMPVTYPDTLTVGSRIEVDRDSGKYNV